MSFVGLRRAQIVAQIVSLLAIPVVIAVFGWSIQSELSDRTLLSENAPIKLSPLALAQLRTGPQLITKVEYVDVPMPIPIPCGPINIKRPKYPYDDVKDEMDLHQKVALLVADKLTRELYIGELESVLIACRGSLNLPVGADGKPLPRKSK